MSTAYCQVTHRQIRQGHCPHCKAVIGETDDAATQTSWNVEVLQADIDHSDVVMRRATARNLLYATLNARDLLPLLALMLADEDQEVTSCGRNQLSVANVRIEDVPWLEEQSLKDETCLAASALLLAFFFHPRDHSEAQIAARRRHICQIIEQYPTSLVAGSPYCFLLEHDDPMGYRQAKDLWNHACKEYPDHVSVLSNAAAFFLLSDWRRSETLLRRAQAIEPACAEWHQRLGHLYTLKSRSGIALQDAKLAKLAYKELQAAERLEFGSLDGDYSDTATLLARQRALVDLARTALECGENEAARKYAHELLSIAEIIVLPEYFRRDGNAVHFGHLVLGRIALLDGDTVNAKEHLLASARIAGSPNLKSFGPNMSLAKALLERGERDAVVQYFDLCGRFWDCGQDQLVLWKSDVEAGHAVNFGPNLYY